MVRALCDWLFGVFLSIGHMQKLQNNLLYINEKFPKQDCMVLFLTSIAASANMIDTAQKFQISSRKCHRLREMSLVIFGVFSL